MQGGVVLYLELFDVVPPRKFTRILFLTFLFNTFVISFCWMIFICGFVNLLREFVTSLCCITSYFEVFEPHYLLETMIIVELPYINQVTAACFFECETIRYFSDRELNNRH